MEEVTILRDDVRLVQSLLLETRVWSATNHADLLRLEKQLGVVDDRLKQLEKKCQVLEGYVVNGWQQ